MRFGKRSFKVFLVTIIVAGCGGGLAWLLYLNSNYHRLPPYVAGSSPARDYYQEATPLADSRNSVAPTVTTLSARKLAPTADAANFGPTASIPTALNPSEGTVDWHYIDPETQKAIKTLLSSNSPVKGGAAVLVPPADFQSGLYNPLGPPSISLTTFEYFLRQDNSPAWPEAATMYQACLQLYCDPALALAFFQHESSMGKQGAAAQNKSLGNIRCVPGAQCRATESNGSFKVYSSWTDGMIDWVILMRESYARKWNLYSLEQIVPRYAPSSDNNDPNGYINTIKKLVDKYRQFRR